MSTRRLLAQALDPKLRSAPGLSNTNKLLIFIIFLSLISAILETEISIYETYKTFFVVSEWFFTIIFTIEYVIRVWVSIENNHYKSRFYYIITPAALFDLFTVLLIVFTSLGTQGFSLRLARLLRVLRVAKLGRYSIAMQNIGQAIYLKRFELIVSFGMGIFALIISSSMLYIIEGGVQPDKFGSIPRAMWWAVSALTTVGYGDVYPITVAGKFFGAITSIVGIGLIAMPTAILAASFGEAIQVIKDRRENRH